MRRTSRAALTLVEMLVAMAVTLIMMGAVVTIFGTVGNSVSSSRATMEISERLRNARNVLQRDLGNITVTMLPPRRPESDEAYFEYVEGAGSDLDDLPPNTAPTGKGIVGDVDDGMLFTARSRGEPYVGTIGGIPAQSLTAEIIYFTGIATGAPTIIDASTGMSYQLRTLYRRVMLVDPSRGTFPANGDSLTDYQGANDLSVRASGTDFIANTLGDLTKPENRFGRDFTGYPFKLLPTLPALVSPRLGEDVLLTNVVSFDVKAYDPNVQVRLTPTTNIAVLPSDVGYDAATTLAGTGGYVDLNYSSNLSNAVTPSNFSGPGNYPAMPGVYDTWSMHYNSPIGLLGGTTFTGSGTDGLDDSGIGSVGIVDDPGEMQSKPPYWVPLRGVQIKIRVYEPDSRQVREVTVVQDFLPQ